ncbi:MAG: hypothetical protein KA766_00335 [Piscinibacter sp.]|uniref:hypothetical protein n=1 Tax=Piscinibacter sp. TaxID=1903157 RepID=UPI001B3F6D69|nr:hypothetical protein [Piscinibacter sp.]MBP5988446.1 hypothetical protein [Piscinibacter sp.]MBP6026066.1 hypothetical protein [Piscinibacter sp.]
MRRFESALLSIGRRWALLAMLTVCALYLYVHQFQETNAYVGIVPMEALGHPLYWLGCAAWLFSIALLLPGRARSPSDVFLTIYLIGTALWSASYWPATQLLATGGAVVLWSGLLLPAALVKTAAWVVRQSTLRCGSFPVRIYREALPPFLIALLLVAALLGYRAAGAFAGFDFEAVYDRRLSGRDSFAGNALAAYALQIATNGLAPFLAYVGATRRSWFAVAAAFGFAIFGFWLLGLKSPFVAVAFLASLGLAVSRGWVAMFPRFVCMVVLAMMAISIVELLVFDVSLIAEFVVRRVVLVTSMIQVYFVDAWSGGSGRMAWMTGIDYGGYTTVEYFIGATYIGNELTNANTNAFTRELAAGGVLGFLLVSGANAALVAYLDHLSHRLHRFDAYAISAILALLLVEQSFTTALVSSGVLLCLLLMNIFSATPRTTDRHTSTRRAT